MCGRVFVHDLLDLVCRVDQVLPCFLQHRESDNGLAFETCEGQLLFVRKRHVSEVTEIDRVTQGRFYNYFFDLEKHPKDEFGDYNFETPEAMDLALINEHLAELDAGRGIDMPVYDFKQGKRIAETKRFESSSFDCVEMRNASPCHTFKNASSFSPVPVTSKVSVDDVTSNTRARKISAST